MKKSVLWLFILIACSSIVYAACTDSDGGGNVATKGTATDSEKNLTDYCDANGKLIEYKCNNGLVVQAWGPVNCSGYGDSTCSNGACVPLNPLWCNDTDNGKDYYKKSQASNWSGTWFDVCYTQNYVESNPLRERYCENSSVKTIEFNCPAGCSNGTCIEDCVSSDDIFQVVCGSDGKNYKNGCYAKNAGINSYSAGPCQIGSANCTDSDGGLEYYKKGGVRIIVPGFDDYDEDTCQGNNLYEHYCEGYNQKIKPFYCANGCSNGTCVKTCTPSCAGKTCGSDGCLGTCGTCMGGYTCTNGKCIKSNATTCTDSDGGLDYGIKGNCYSSITSRTDYDYCDEEVGGTKKGGLEEVSCKYIPIGEGSPELEGKTSCVYESFTCPNGCSNGTCMAYTNSTTCTDSDNGKNYFVKGITTGLYWQDTINKGPIDYTDSCSGCDSNLKNCKYVHEQFCRSDGKVDGYEYSCPLGCLNGACISNCTELWECTKWTPCISGTQLRVCTDINHCGTQISMPQLYSMCQIINNLTYQINQPLNKTNPSQNNTGVRVVIKNVSFIGGVEVKLEKGNLGTKMHISNSQINTTLDLIERDKKVYAITTNGEKEIIVLPWDAISTAKKIKDVESVEIEEYKGKPVYSISGTKKARLLFLIPLTAKVNQKVNLEDGKIAYTKKPWWHFIALGV